MNVHRNGVLVYLLGIDYFALEKMKPATGGRTRLYNAAVFLDKTFQGEGIRDPGWTTIEVYLITRVHKYMPQGVNIGGARFGEGSRKKRCYLQLLVRSD